MTLVVTVAVGTGADRGVASFSLLLFLARGLGDGCGNILSSFVFFSDTMPPVTPLCLATGMLGRLATAGGILAASFISSISSDLLCLLWDGIGGLMSGMSDLLCLL